MSADRVQILDASALNRALTRVAHEILERNSDAEGLRLVGIRTRGVPLAERLASRIEAIESRRPITGMLDINLYRDDLSLVGPNAVLRKTEIPFDVDGTGLVLVDDVLFTGRTTRAALDALMDLGRPAWVQLAVLVDRGHREVPIKADYVGKNIPTSRDQQVEVRIEETDGREEVVVLDSEVVDDAKGRAR